MSRIALAALFTCAMLSPVLAQNGAPESENGRYSFNRVEDGYLRLDQRNGQVSLCSRRSVGWACNPLPDERSALEDEIGRLQTDNVALKKELLSRGLSLPGAMKPEPPVAKAPDGGTKQPDLAEIDRAMAMAEKVWKRLVEMISRLQRDIFTQI